MAGGPNDSSLTRVQPVFTELAERASPSWLMKLLQLGSRASSVTLPSTAAPLRSPPSFEHACLAPNDLLQWMITNPDKLDWSALERSKLHPNTLAKRRALRDCDPVVMQDALERLRTKGGRPGSGGWHVLEGVTKVDCALFGEDLTVFVEGKRTEPHLTDRVSWLRGRDQVVRNLDCLRVEPQRTSSWFVLLVVEEASTAEADARRLDRSRDYVAAALPHLAADQVAEVWSHYAGYTTWQAIQHALLV
jgi:hypothetical protein